MSKWSHYQTKPGYHKWRHRRHVGPFIDPDGEDRLFYDLGANAGYHMREAQKLGYRAIGVEYDEQSIALSPDLDIRHGDVNYLDPLPAHTTLLSCVHYHQSDEQAAALFHNLSYTTVYAIVMGRHKGKPRSNPTLPHLKANLLRGYRILDKRESRIFYSVLLKSKRCDELNIDDLYEATRAFTETVRGYDDWVPSFEEFVRRCLDDMEYDARGSDWMAYLRRRRLNGLARCWEYKRIIKSLQQDGIKTAVKIADGHVTDGMHRLVILRELGKKRVICRR